MAGMADKPENKIVYVVTQRAHGDVELLGVFSTEEKATSFSMPIESYKVTKIETDSSFYPELL
jgi:hypothetical protein